jgi:hypothetical protein
VTVVEPWSDDPQVREDPALEGLLTVLRKEARRPVPPAVRYEHLAAVFEQAAALASPPRAPRRWAGRLAALTTSKVILAAGVAAASTSGLAATGHLPAPVQRLAHDVAEHVGLDLPLPPDGADAATAPPADEAVATARSHAPDVHAHTAPTDPGRSGEAPGRADDLPGAPPRADGDPPGQGPERAETDVPGGTATDRGVGPADDAASDASAGETPTEASSAPDGTATETSPAPTETDPATGDAGTDAPADGGTAAEEPTDTDSTATDPTDTTVTDSPPPDDTAVAGPPGPPASPGDRGRGNGDCQPRSGSDCSSDNVAANRSPAPATRASTSPGSNTNAAPPSAAAATSSQSTGVETVGRGRARSE